MAHRRFVKISGLGAAGLLPALLWLSACVHYGPPPEVRRATVPVAWEPASYFDYAPAEEPAPEGPFQDWGLYEVQKLSLPLSLEKAVQEDSYALYYYRPKGAGPFPAVVILPITQGDYFTQNFAIYLAERGYACLRFGSTKNFTDDSHETLKAAEQLLRHYVMDIRRGADWLLARPEVDPERLGILGLSLGAVVGGMVMAVDSRIRAGVLMLGGANLPGILDTSWEKSLVRFRQRVLEHEGLAPEQFPAAAAQVLEPVDPLRYAHRLNAAKVLMINGYFDRVIRKRFVKQFWEAAGRPELIFIPTGHYSAGLFLPYARAKAEAHFRKTLR